MHILLWIAIPFIALITALVLFRMLGAARYRSYVAWETENRKELNYYGKPLAHRRAFRREIKTRSRGLLPFLKFEARVQKIGIDLHSFEYDGVWGPKYSCTPETFKAAAAYPAGAQDIFVATQMKCGTTWMQQVAYEILHKGDGDLGDGGHRHLNAVSPWIESFDGVPMDQAPLLGASRRRLIKTHLPVKLCPYGPQAKYLYVTRHPVSCYASVLDYFRLMAGPLSPPELELLDWFCSDRLWWLSWPDHVAGWWDWAQQKPNVLFLHFEEMKKDLAGVVRRTAQFLGESLTEEQIRKVVRKSGFGYMKEHEEQFEMSPANLFSVNGTYFKSGQADRYKDALEADRCRILNFCKENLKGSSYPTGQFYPDIPDPG
jgi:aryl sulfotransferase